MFDDSASVQATYLFSQFNLGWKLALVAYLFTTHKSIPSEVNRGHHCVTYLDTRNHNHLAA
jgi:hypothetical protein